MGHKVTAPLIGVLLLLAPSAMAQLVGEAPSVEITRPQADATVNGSVTIEGNASDPDGNVSHVEIRIDEDPWRNATGTTNWTYAWETTDLDDGDHTIRARAHDGEQYSKIAWRNVTVDNQQDAPDTTPPNVTIEHPPNLAKVSGTVDIQGTASDTDGNVTTVEVRIDHGDWQPATGLENWTFSWDTSNVSEETHTITARATDNASATTSTTREVFVQAEDDGTDPATPDIEILSPDDGAEVSGTVNISGTASAPTGALDKVEIRIDDGPWRNATGTAEWNATWETTGTETGPHTIQARATAGAEQAIARTNVTVTNGSDSDRSGEFPFPPEVTISSPAAGANVSGTVTVSGTASDEDGDLAKVQARIDEGSWHRAEGLEDWTVELDLANASAGNVTIVVRALDEDDHETRAERTVVHDAPLRATAAPQGPPTLELKAPTGNTTVEQTLRLRGEATAPGAPGATLTLLVEVDGGPSWRFPVATDQPFEKTLDVRMLSPGEHTLTVHATDGNRTSSPQEATIEIQGGQGDRLSTVPGPLPAAIGAALATAAVLARRRDR